MSIIVSVIAAALLLLVLGAIVRFSIVSPRRTGGAADRLQYPDAASVERVCGFPPPPDLVELYRDGSLTRRSDFSLIDKSREPRSTWFFGRFYPLTGQDALEQRKVHGITRGIPIADDLDKGVYFVNRDGKIMFRPAGWHAHEIEVAPSAAALSRFEVST